MILLSFQISFSQKTTVKGIVKVSKTFNPSIVNVIINDTINKLQKYNHLTYTNSRKVALQKNNFDNLYLEYEKNKEILLQLKNNKNYITHTDSLGNFEIEAKTTDSLYFKSLWHTTEKYLVSDLIKTKEINIKLKVEPCEVWPSHHEKPTRLFVFVGKKIKTWNSPSSYCNDSFNSRTLAKYEVVQNIYNVFPKDTIQFTSYSHEILIPQNYYPYESKFNKFDYSLLYVLEFPGEYIQVKYLFDDVYLTKEGKWASPLKPEGTVNYINPNESYHPKKINLITPIEFTYDIRLKDKMKQLFPESYNHLTNRKIRVTHGYYVEDLFKIRKTGWLKKYQYLFN